MGWSPEVAFNCYHLVSANSNNATLISAGNVIVGGWCIHNKSASTLRVILHNKATTPTAGADVTWVIKIPAGATANSEMRLNFPLGLGITIIGGDTDNATTPLPALNDIDLNLAWRVA